jgi:penicillin-binding protein 1A
MIVAAFLALGQLIAPVPEAAVDQAIAKVQARQSCVSLAKGRSEFETRNCESLRPNRREFKKQCQSVENEMNANEVQCTTDSEVAKVLRYRPRRLEEYMTLSNDKLVEELHIICGALQDRIFLEPSEWMSGQTANRDDLSSKLVVLQKNDLQQLLSKVLKEANDGELQAADAYKTLMFICHWKVDRKEVARQIDFTGGYGYLKRLLSELPNVDVLPELPQASYVYDDQGQRIGEIYDKEFVSRNGKRYLGQVHRRRVALKNEIPPMLSNAFIAIEDKRFREHNGFDFEAIKRVVYGGMQGSKEGGSTFTMQLVKNAFFDQDVESERGTGRRTLRRKLKEILMLPKVEARYKKDEILTYYLNLIGLTPNAQGVRMASIDLYGKSDLNLLTIPEMALLAAMPKGASMYNPRRFPEVAKSRRDLILKAMGEQGYFPLQDVERYQKQPIQLANLADIDQARVLSRFFVGYLTNHFFAMKNQNLRDPRWTMGGFDLKTGHNQKLQEVTTHSLQTGLLNFEKNTGRYKWKPWLDERSGHNVNIKPKVVTGDQFEVVSILKSMRVAHPYPETNWLIATKTPSKSNFSGHWLLEDGAKVEVSAADRAIFNSLSEYDLVLLDRREGGSVHLASGSDVQGAAVVIDIETGEVQALSGGFTAGAYGKFAQNNRAAAMRMPGSTVKPFAYLYALNHGVAPTKVLRNTGMRFPKIANCPFQWSPGNYGSSAGGSMPLEIALQKSVNLAMVNLFVSLTGIPPSALSNPSGAGPDVVHKIEETLYNIYDFAVALGAYPSRRALAAANFKGPCLPYILGGQETSPLNMAQAYASLGNGGLKREAVFLKEVLKENTPLIVDNSDQKREQVAQYRNALHRNLAVAPEAFGVIPGIKPDAMATIRSLMQGVVRNGTAVRIRRWADLIGGKTGTTNDSHDTWFIGFNAKIAIAVWVGYDNDSDFYPNLGTATGGAVALPIFESIMASYYQMHPEELNNRLPSPKEVMELKHSEF